MIYTKGKNFNTSFYLPLAYYKGSIKNIFPEKYLSILFYSKAGNYFLELINSENILLKNYKKLEQLIFYPKIINSEYSFENIKKENSFDNDNKLDLYLISPFLESKKIKIFLTFIEKENIKKIFKELNIQLKSQEDALWPCQSKKNFYQLLFYIQTLIDTNNNNKKKLTLETDIEKIEIYLKNNYLKKININNIIKGINTNRTTAYKNFKLKHNITIHTYLIKIKISIACKLLIETNLPIGEIAYNSGFYSYNNFLVQFKKAKKIAPCSYRSLNKLSL